MAIYGSVFNSLSDEEKEYMALEAKAISELEVDEYLNESIDHETGKGGKLRPVFTALIYGDGAFEKIADKVVPGQQYWHAALSFGPSLTTLYSFGLVMGEANKGKGGLSIENVNEYKKTRPNGKMFVGCILVKPYKYAQIKKGINYYLKNKQKTRYAFEKLVKSFFHIKEKNGMKFNMVCTEFVDAMLKQAGIDLTGMNSNLVKADNFLDSYKNNPDKQFKVYEGPITEYDEDKAAKIVEKLVDNESLNFFGRKKKDSNKEQVEEKDNTEDEKKE